MSPYHSSVVLEASDWLGKQPFPRCQDDSRQRLPHSLNVPVLNSCSAPSAIPDKRDREEKKQPQPHGSLGEPFVGKFPQTIYK